MSSAVLQTSFLGDMVLTTPLLTRLAEAGPVHVVATPANAAVLGNHPAVTSVIVFDKRGADNGWRGLRRVAQRLRDTGARSAYLAQGSVRTAMLARLAGIPNRIGFATSPGRFLYTQTVAFNQQLHHAERLWQLASAADGGNGEPTLHGSRHASGLIAPTPSARRPSLFPSARDHEIVDALLAEYDVGADDQLVALAPGSVWATKRWPSYAELAKHLVMEMHGVAARIVVIGGEADRPLAKAIAAAVTKVSARPVIDATGRLSLLASAALLSRCRILVSNDSAPLHLASAMNTPTVALFGPTVPSLGFGPLADQSTVVEHASLLCRPCGAHGPQQCPLGHWRCMRELSVHTVADTVVGAVAPC